MEGNQQNVIRFIFADFYQLSHLLQRMTLQQREPFEDLAKKAAKPKKAKPKVKTLSDTNETSFAEKTITIRRMVSQSLLNGSEYLPIIL